MTKILEMRKDKLQVTAYSSREEMGAAAAHSAAQCFRELLKKKEMEKYYIRMKLKKKKEEIEFMNC